MSFAAVIAGDGRARAGAPNLKAYVGQYRTETGVLVVVRDAGGTLWASVRGAPPVLFLSEGGGSFYAPDNGVTLDFAPGGFRLGQPGRPDLFADRIDG